MAEPASRRAPGHYFDPTPTTRSAPGEVRLDLPDRSFTLVTDRGVFSPDRIDTGTKHLLLEVAAPAAQGTIVDLGCGYGAIACTLAARSPRATVWALDVNERALELCRINAERLGLANLRVAAEGAAPLDLVVDELWSNPPIRVGKAALHELLESWLRRLSPRGRALLVVQKHLGADSLHRWLEGEGWQVHRRCSRAGYRILEVRPS
jgi:16S rRNA (guanine1207-N2)-methyltransferase